MEHITHIIKKQVPSVDELPDIVFSRHRGNNLLLTRYRMLDVLFRLSKFTREEIRGITRLVHSQEVNIFFRYGFRDGWARYNISSYVQALFMRRYYNSRGRDKLYFEQWEDQ